jgi:hypothetical protein
MFQDSGPKPPETTIQTPTGTPLLDGLPKRLQKRRLESVRDQVASLAGVSPSLTWKDLEQLIADGAPKAERALSALTVIDTGWLALPSIRHWLRDFDLSFYGRDPSIKASVALDLQTEDIVRSYFSPEGSAKAAIISTLVLGDMLVRQRDLVEMAGVEHQMRVLIGIVADTYREAVGDYLSIAQAISRGPEAITTTEPLADHPVLRIPSPTFLATFQTFMFSLAIGPQGTAQLAPFRNQPSWSPEDSIPHGEFPDREWPGHISPVELEHWFPLQRDLARIAETYVRPPE